MTSCVENDEFKTLEEFVANAQKIFNNCRIYNEEGTKHFILFMERINLFNVCGYYLGTNYVKCANKLEKWFKERLKVLRTEMLL